MIISDFNIDIWMNHSFSLTIIVCVRIQCTETFYNILLICFIQIRILFDLNWFHFISCRFDWYLTLSNWYLSLFTVYLRLLRPLCNPAHIPSEMLLASTGKHYNLLLYSLRRLFLTCYIFDNYPMIDDWLI